MTKTRSLTFEEAVVLPFDEFLAWSKSRNQNARGPEATYAPLRYGEKTAWTIAAETRTTTTNVSDVHRVGDGDETLCGKPLHYGNSRFAPLASLTPCFVCEQVWRQAVEGDTRTVAKGGSRQ